jgi:mono/diheme cytochrome c family protein
MKFRLRLLAVAGLLAVLLSAASYFFLRADSSPTARLHSLRPADPEVLRVGERVYRQKCAACHGAQGEGQAHWRERGPDGLLPAPPHDASGHTWHHPDALLFDITKQGLAKVIHQADYRTAMPVYEGVLSDDEIVAVLSWIKSQWPADVQKRHDKVNAQYEAGLEK